MGTTTEKLTYLQGTKDAIKNAIVAKGVEVPEGTTFRGYAEKVGEIPEGNKKITITVNISDVGGFVPSITSSLDFIDKAGSYENFNCYLNKLVVVLGEPMGDGFEIVDFDTNPVEYYSGSVRVLKIKSEDAYINIIPN